MRQNVKDDNWSEAVVELPPIGDTFETVATNTKTYTIPSNGMWLLNWIHLSYTANATVGNRKIGLHIYDGSNNERWSIESEINQTAGNTVHYIYIQGVARETSLGGNNDIVSILPKDMYLKPGWKITFHDSAGISAGDNMGISFQYKEYTV